MSSELAVLITILKDVRSGSISIVQAERNVALIDWEKLYQIGEVYHCLTHFWADSDIREKDQAYDDFQTAELNKLIDHLENRNFNLAVEVSFLSVT